MTRRRKPRAVVIVGRKWFDRVNGNTYYSAAAYIDGEQAHRIEYSYGYGTQYEQDMLRDLEELKLIPPRLPPHENGMPSEPWWKYTERTGIKIAAEASHVARKKDL